MVEPFTAHPELIKQTARLLKVIRQHRKLCVDSEKPGDKNRWSPPLSDFSANRTRSGGNSIENHFDVMTAFYQWCGAYARVMTQKKIPFQYPQEIDSRIKTAMVWLRERDLSLPLRESDLAKRVGLSVSQLNRLFLRYFDSTPQEFNEQSKIETAIRLLERTENSMKSLAYQLGFSSPGNFSTWFRRKTNQTPTLWRQQRKQAKPGDPPPLLD